LVFVISYALYFLIIFFATGKVEFEGLLVTATGINNFIFTAIALNTHKQFVSIPIFPLNEKPIKYLLVHSFLFF